MATENYPLSTSENQCMCVCVWGAGGGDKENMQSLYPQTCGSLLTANRNTTSKQNENKNDETLIEKLFPPLCRPKLCSRRFFVLPNPITTAQSSSAAACTRGFFVLFFPLLSVSSLPLQPARRSSRSVYKIVSVATVACFLRFCLSDTCICLHVKHDRNGVSQEADLPSSPPHHGSRVCIYR